ncbi:MAG: hypothetical protein OXH75_27435 [Acidobacteria bacterium]|nr:hypothetical protein [Acidobacteriota bacterium]
MTWLADANHARQPPPGRLGGRAQSGAAGDVTAVPAPDADAATEYDPAQDWFALLEVPGPDEFAGTGPDGNGISPNIESQGEWIRSVVNTDGCTGCHALGNKATREIPEGLGDFDSHLAAWDRRVQSGQAGAIRDARLAQAGRDRALAMYADWTDRIQAGEYPTTPPPRPRGVERNVVVTRSRVTLCLCPPGGPSSGRTCRPGHGPPGGRTRR